MKRPLVQPSISKGSALQNLQFNWKICHVVKLKKTFPQVLYFRRGAPSHFMVSLRIGLLDKRIYCDFAADVYQKIVWCTSAEIECLLTPPGK